MKETRSLMGMTISIEVLDSEVKAADIAEVYDYLTYVDETFSTYKETSEISQINAGSLPKEKWSKDMQFVMKECERTKQETNGFFDIAHNGKLDPSGYVKGWAIQNAAELLEKKFKKYYVDVGGDIQAMGKAWTVGIRSPFNQKEIVKHVSLENMAMATSGTYIRGQHIYDPHQPDKTITEILSLSVIGKLIVDADRFATAAFAMGRKGIEFIASLPGLEGYMIDSKGIATFTSGFNRYVLN